MVDGFSLIDGDMVFHGVSLFMGGGLGDLRREYPMTFIDMKPDQRVALRYARRLEIENPNRAEKIKYTINGDVSSYYQVILYHGRKRIGQVQGGLENGTLVPVWEGREPPVEDLKCSSDVLSLVDKFPQVVEKDWKNRPKARIVSISNSAIEDEYKGKKIGTDMYLAFARAYWDETGKPFIFIPNGCSGAGLTSDEAKRVWASLGRKYPSSGLCLAILKRP